MTDTTHTENPIKPPDLITCNDTLRKTYLELISTEFKLRAAKDGFKEWEEKQERYTLFKRQEASFKSRMDNLRLEMHRLAALGEQYELGLDV